MEHWSDELTHEKLITPEAKTVLQEYDSKEEYMAAGLEAKKMVGSPFRLPKSLEGLPDDKVRGEFISGVEKVLGVKKIQGEEDLEGIDFAKGYKDATDSNKDDEAATRKFIIEKGLTKQQAEDLIAHQNQTRQDRKNARAQGIIDKAEEVKETLTVMCGSKEKVETSYDGVRKLFQNHCGLSSQEYEDVGKSFVGNTLTKDAIMSKALFNLAESIVTEGGTEEGSKGGAKKPESITERQNKSIPITVKALGWKNEK